jgi:hypothetical protein
MKAASYYSLSTGRDFTQENLNTNENTRECLLAHPGYEKRMTTILL